MSTQLSLFDEPMAMPPRIGTARVTATDTVHILTPGKGRISWYDYSLNPYRGCSFACSYCYAASFVADDNLREEWGAWVEVKVRAAEALWRKDLRDKRIYMSTVTDPYQPIEAHTKLTRSVVEVLRDQKARLVVQTRSPLVARDVDLFQGFDHVRVNMSITTDSDEIRKRFEPSCASIERRLEAIKAVKAAGIKTSVCICPMLPMKDPAGFGKTLAEIDPDYATASWFHFDDRLFASGTRAPALKLLAEGHWTHRDFERTVAEIRSTFPSLSVHGEGFRPE